MKNRYKKKNVKTKTNKMLFLLVTFFILSLSVGYANIYDDLYISGEAKFRIEKEIRITNVTLNETTNSALENYSVDYSVNTINAGVDLKQIDSTVKYKVEVSNTGSVAQVIDNITLSNNTYVEYQIENITLKRGLVNTFPMTLPTSAAVKVTGTRDSASCNLN